MANLEDTTVTGSDSDPGHPHVYCKPCKTDGTVVTAVGYCKNCEEYLCQRCYDVYLIPSRMRKHELVGVEHSIDSKNQNTGQRPMRCNQHTDKPIEYHCPSHLYFGCHICFFQNHRTCPEVKFIPDIAKNVTSTKEYEEFKSTLAGVAANCGDLIAKMEAYEKEIDISHCEAIRDFQAYKKEVLDAISNIEKQFMERVDKLKQEETLYIMTVEDKVKTLLSESHRIATTTELLQTQQQDYDLYRHMVLTKERLSTLETEILDAQSSIRQRTFVFKVNPDVLNTLKQPFGLGLLQDTIEARRIISDSNVTKKSRRIQKLEHVSDINIKCSGENRNNRITGSILVSKDKLVLADYTNKKVKLCDPGRNKVISYLNFNSQPWGVCKVDDNQVAITLYERKVVLVALAPLLSVVREIPVNGDCRGVGYCDGKLVVSYNSSERIEVLDMQGSVLTVVRNSTNGQSLFNNPVQLCVNASRRLIYVSDFSKDVLLCLKLDGTVVSRCTDRELAGPYQAVVDSSGTVYVCGRNSHTVHQVTRDCQKVRLLLSAADGLVCPESISYDESEGRVYIGQYNCAFLRVYSVTSEQIKM